ncbi:MAG TPA: hypothetical protein VFF43_15965 [Caldimonas sp.]|nr:hypothetical protein [Caldimonas sp.]
MALETHCPFWQDPPFAQSTSDAQFVLQALAPHAYTPQSIVVGAGQWPWPSQLAAAVALPSTQLASRQD